MQINSCFWNDLSDLTLLQGVVRARLPLLTLLPSPALVALTHEVVVKRFTPGGISEEVCFIRVREHVTRAGVLPEAAPVAAAQLEAAAAGVGPQRPDEGTQDSADVVSEKDALMLEGRRKWEVYMQMTHNDEWPRLGTVHTLDLANVISPHSTTPAAPSAALSPSVCTRSVCTHIRSLEWRVCLYPLANIFFMNLFA